MLWRFWGLKCCIFKKHLGRRENNFLLSVLSLEPVSRGCLSIGAEETGPCVSARVVYRLWCQLWFSSWLKFICTEGDPKEKHVSPSSTAPGGGWGPAVSWALYLPFTLTCRATHLSFHGLLAEKQQCKCQEASAVSPFHAGQIPSNMHSVRV